METTQRNSESKMQQETELFDPSGGNSMEGGSINPTKGTKDVSPIGSGVRKCGQWVSQENRIKKLDLMHNKGLRIAL
jgi:hypothetical protein